MAHTHPVIDGDSRFVINSTTRAISTTSDNLELIQGDRRSERITFEIPKIVEGRPHTRLSQLRDKGGM